MGVLRHPGVVRDTGQYPSIGTCEQPFGRRCRHDAQKARQRHFRRLAARLILLLPFGQSPIIGEPRRARGLRKIGALLVVRVKRDLMGDIIATAREKGGRQCEGMF